MFPSLMNDPEDEIQRESSVRRLVSHTDRWYVVAVDAAHCRGGPGGVGGGAMMEEEERFEHVPDAQEEQLSALDAAFLFFERPNQPFQIGCVAILEQCPSLEELTERLAERLEDVPRFRQMPLRSRLDLRWPVWREDPAFDPRRHVRHVALPAPGDEATLHHVIETLLSTPLPADRPRWEFHLIAGLEGGRAALLCKVHHCMADGISALRTFETIADAPAGERPHAAKPVEALAARAPQRSRGLAGALAEAVVNPRRALRGGVRDLAETLDTIASFVDEPLTPMPFNGSLGHGRRLVWRSHPFEELASLRLAADCTINDVLLAIVSGALRSYLEDHETDVEQANVRAVVPTSVRKKGAELELGNQVTAVFPRLPVHVPDPVARLHAVRDEMRQLKERRQGRATGLVLALAGALPSVTEASVLGTIGGGKLVSTLCTNVPGPSETLRLVGRRVLAIHPIAPLFLDVGLAFAATSYAGQFSICAVADPALVPDADRLGVALDEALYETRSALWERSQALAVASRLANGPTVADVMIRDVPTIAESDSLECAHDLMRRRRVRHIPVLDRGLRVIGVLSQGDLLIGAPKAPATMSEAERADALGRTPAALAIERGLSVAAPDEAALEAGRRMLEREVDVLPVVDERGHLLGLVTEEQILRWTTQRMPHPAVAAGGRGRRSEAARLEHARVDLGVAQAAVRRTVASE